MSRQWHDIRSATGEVIGSYCVENGIMTVTKRDGWQTKVNAGRPENWAGLAQLVLTGLGPKG